MIRYSAKSNHSGPCLSFPIDFYLNEAAEGLFVSVPQPDRLTEVLEDPLLAAASRRGSAGGRRGGALGRVWGRSGRWNGRLRGLGPVGWLHSLFGGLEPHSATPPL